MNEAGFAVEPLLKDPPRLKRRNAFPHVSRETTRHGKEVWYFRYPGGLRTRLPVGPGQDGFAKAYATAKAGERPAPRPKPSVPRHPRTRGYVYFMRVGSVIKIGFSVQPLARVEELKTGLYERIKAFVFIEGDQILERSLHKRFNAYRTSGEWFKASPALVQMMAHCAAYGEAAQERIDTRSVPASPMIRRA